MYLIKLEQWSIDGEEMTGCRASSPMTATNGPECLRAFSYNISKYIKINLHPQDDDDGEPGRDAEHRGAALPHGPGQHERQLHQQRARRAAAVLRAHGEGASHCSA